MTKQDIIAELDKIMARVKSRGDFVTSLEVGLLLHQLKQGILMDVSADDIANEAANEQEGSMPGRL
jgi:hypothetical protein